MKKYAVIRVKPDTKEKADKLIKKHGKTGIKFYEAAMNYFEKTKINPFDYEESSTTKEVKQLRQDISRILKKDRNFTQPIMIRLDKTVISLKEYIDKKAPAKEDLVSSERLINYELKLQIKELQNSLLKIANSAKKERQSFSKKEKIVLDMEKEQFEILTTGGSKNE